MPTVMWQLFLVYLFQWYAMMCYWQNNSKSIALSVWNVTPKNAVGYEKAVEWNGLIGAFGFIVTFSIAFYLAKQAKKFGAKMIHFICLVLGAVSFLCFPMVENQYVFFAVIIGYGIAWASMMGIPYLMVVAVIPNPAQCGADGVACAPWQGHHVRVSGLVGGLGSGHAAGRMDRGHLGLALGFRGCGLAGPAVCRLGLAGDAQRHTPCGAVAQGLGTGTGL